MPADPHPDDLAEPMLRENASRFVIFPMAYRYRLRGPRRWTGGPRAADDGQEHAHGRFALVWGWGGNTYADVF